MKQLHVKHGLKPDPETPGVPLHTYTVHKVINSVHPIIETVLTPEEINGYCESELWHVTVT